MDRILSALIGSFVGGCIGSFAGRVCYEHYVRWRIERLAILARETQLAALRARLAEQLQGLESWR